MDQALYGVIMEGYIGGVSTRKVDALVAALEQRPVEWCNSGGAAPA